MADDKIIPRRVETLEEAQVVRQIRNTVARYMTNDTRQITPEEQKEWFQQYLTTEDRLFLYTNDLYAVIGYGYVRERENKYWGTLAVLFEFQGLGYGTQIYNHLRTIPPATEPLWIEIYSDNTPSLISALKSGFEIDHIDDKVIVLRG